MTIRKGAALRRRPLAARTGEESGFTLIELVLVMVVMGALLLNAVPAFLTARENTQHRAAQADLRHALEAANAAYVDSPDFGSLSAASLGAVETALRFSDTPVNSPGSVAVSPVVASDGTSGLALAEPSGDGLCWYVVQPDSGAALYGRAPQAGGLCDAADPPSALYQSFPA